MKKLQGFHEKIAGRLRKTQDGKGIGKQERQKTGKVEGISEKLRTMAEENVITIGTASIGTELLFGLLISSVNLLNADAESKRLMLADFAFDIAKIFLTSLFIHYSRSQSIRGTMSDCRKAVCTALAMLTAVAVAMISNVLCMWICMQIWTHQSQGFPGLKELSMVSLVLFSVVRVGLFSAFMIAFIQFVRKKKQAD